MVYVLGMLPMVSKELGNAQFNVIIFQTWAVVQGEVALRVEQRQCTRMGLMGNATVVEGGFALWAIDANWITKAYI